MALLAGCVSTRFEEYRGHAVFEGKGGGVHTVKGIDIWDVGEPDCQYKIIGYIHQDVVENHSLLGGPMTDSASQTQMVNEAKTHGGDAIVFLSSSSQAVGAVSFNNGYATSTHNYTGTTTTSLRAVDKHLVAVVKYLKPELGTPKSQ